ncbi:unnamed protein product [Mytilus coruscus]|uniref:Uncharacterized protein n=1 Tax=Mytilus coruscus TaxID=42192 RepID=A0A6J8CRB4_MYTCO|nr:unnamed protein product [Mytilus coruscus]
MSAATESSSSRVSKPPSKFSDFLMVDDFDKMFEDQPVNDPSKIEIAVEHPQSDGKTNNVTFKTSPSRIELWKKTIISHFGQSKTILLKEGSVIKVTCDINTDKNCSIKINFFNTGSVVIQGAKCTAFSDQYFSKLKSKIDSDFDNEVFINNHDNTAVEVHDVSDNDCSQTKLKQLDIDAIDSNNNNSTGIIELDTVDENKTSTPL